MKYSGPNGWLVAPKTYSSWEWDETGNMNTNWANGSDLGGGGGGAQEAGWGGNNSPYSTNFGRGMVYNYHYSGGKYYDSGNEVGWDEVYHNYVVPHSYWSGNGVEGLNAGIEILSTMNSETSISIKYGKFNTNAIGQLAATLPMPSEISAGNVANENSLQAYLFLPYSPSSDFSASNHHNSLPGIETSLTITQSITSNEGEFLSHNVKSAFSVAEIMSGTFESAAYGNVSTIAKISRGMGLPSAGALLTNQSIKTINNPTGTNFVKVASDVLLIGACVAFPEFAVFLVIAKVAIDESLDK